MGADGACLYVLQALLYLQQQFDWSSTHLDGHDVCVRPVQSNAITKWSEHGPVRGGVLVHKYIHLAGSEPMLTRAVLRARQHFLQQLQCGICVQQHCITECYASSMWSGSVLTVGVVDMQQL